MQQIPVPTSELSGTRHAVYRESDEQFKLKPDEPWPWVRPLAGQVHGETRLVYVKLHLPSLFVTPAFASVANRGGNLCFPLQIELHPASVFPNWVSADPTTILKEA